jgi:hypothetical protein
LLLDIVRAVVLGSEFRGTHKHYLSVFYREKRRKEKRREKIVGGSSTALEGLHSSKIEPDIINAKFSMLPFGNLHVKHEVQRGISVRTQHLFRVWDQEKLRETLMELAGRRIFRMQTDF